MRAFYRRKTKSRAGRTARFETLENRLLLTTSRGVEPTAFDALKADWPGFDYSGIVAEEIIVVDATNGIDAQTLRRAIAEAKSNDGPDLIVVQTGTADATLGFASTDEVFTIDDAASLTIVATGPQKLTIDANAKSRIFEISSVSQLALGGVALIDGAAVDGGAVYNAGTLFLDGVYVASNVASGDGGGIYNASNLTVVNSIITDNRAGGNGGGVCSNGVYDADASLKRAHFIACDVVGNAAGVDGTGWGGGIYFAGQDADFNIFAEMRLDASIVVQNRSSATECDANIYNSAFYNEVEIDGERYVFEIPVAALIDGDYNITSFNYWVSSYDPNDPSVVGSNQIYREATPLFARDYDFETRKIGDYALYESSLSQAIDKIPLADAVYPNGRSFVRDFAGKRRVQNGALDAGALEVQRAQTDLATRDGAQASASATVVGGKLRVDGVEVSNLSELAAEDFRIQFFASEDLIFDDADVLVGEIGALRLAENATQRYCSNDLATEFLTPGTSYYFYWRVVADADSNAANNIGATNGAVVFYAENDEEIDSAPFEFENYRTQRDSAFYLSVSQKVEERFGDGFSYWWDYGDGRFVEGKSSDWVFPPTNVGPDVSIVALKIVDNATQTVVAKGSAALETILTAPTIACNIRESANDSLLILSFAAQGNGNRTIKEWKISWGDGTTSTFNVLGTELTVGKRYATSTETKTYQVSLTIEEAGSQNAKTTYRLPNFRVEGNAISAARSASDAPTVLDVAEAGKEADAEPLDDAPIDAASHGEANSLAPTGKNKATLAATTSVADRFVPECVDAERENLGLLLGDATREFRKRRNDKTSLFDERDERLESALELLARNALR